MDALDKKALQDYRKKIDINPFTDKIADFRTLKDRISCLVMILKDREIELNRYAKLYMSAQDEWTEYAAENFLDLAIKVVIYERKLEPEST